MHITHIEEKPVHRIQFLNAAKRGGVVSQVLPILKARVDALPNDLDALLLTGDLQGVVNVWQGNTTRLLGIELVDVYGQLAEQNLVPNPSSTGIILAGDFYSAPDGAKRGASGDVRSVWQAFADRFRWVAGVQGNHDRFGTEQEKQALAKQANIHLFDYGSASLDNLNIAGVSGIIGDPAKEGRREESEFVSALELVLENNPDILVVHQGPNGDASQRGSELVRRIILKNPVPLTVCGHVYWQQPLAFLDASSQLVNVDSRALVLTR